MARHLRVIVPLTLALALVAVLVALPSAARHAAANEERAAPALEAAGATLERDVKAPGKPVVRAVLLGNRINDEVMAHVGALTNLRQLVLIGTGVTDKGLGHVAGLAKLTRLQLDGAALTDKGL